MLLDCHARIPVEIFGPLEDCGIADQTVVCAKAIKQGARFPLDLPEARQLVIVDRQRIAMLAWHGGFLQNIGTR